jgi:hypothetical protein
MPRIVTAHGMGCEPGNKCGTGKTINQGVKNESYPATLNYQLPNASNGASNGVQEDVRGANAMTGIDKDKKIGEWGAIILRLLATEEGRRTSIAKLARHSIRTMNGEEKPVDYIYLHSLLAGEKMGKTLVPSVEVTLAVLSGLLKLGIEASRHDQESLLSLSIKDLPDWAKVRIEDETETLIRKLDYDSLRIAEFYKGASTDVRHLLDTLTAPKLVGGSGGQVDAEDRDAEEHEEHGVYYDTACPEVVAKGIERSGAVGGHKAIPC